ncbi:hypothetical protein ACBI99_12205 [Nonomuraea sp. ATR24]|uniref:hypothetical protein n=1 Tax=Nonomuraea TaxID=83681 RepID=UPI001C5E26D2|nr:hypothetical protein [Nonomuraea ceibae]
MSWHHYRARWQGEDFEASPEPHSLELWIRLRSAEPREGFEEVEPGCHVLPVPAEECEALHFVITVCEWRGEPFHVHAERDGELLLEYAGASAPRAVELGLDRIERGVYRRWVPRAEAADLREEAVPLDEIV